MAKLLLITASLALIIAQAVFALIPIAFGRLKHTNSNSFLTMIAKDEKGYVIKDRDWFSGLSLDAGASLTDPRAIPVEAQEFAKKLREGGKVSSIDETLKVLDANFDYFEVPFTNGDVKNDANTNTGSAKILSFGLLARLSEEETLKMFGPLSENLSPNGTDHPNIRAFKKTGWAGVVFPTGLAILSKAQAFENTDDGLSTQGVIVGKENSWDINSDSWIP